MLEARLGFFMRQRQGQPALHAEHLLARRARTGRRALGMDDAAPGGHQIHRARRDFLHIRQTVAMQNASVEKIGDGRKPDMGMRTHVHPLPRRELNRAEMIVEDERPDHLAPVVGQARA